jgi:tRNA A-37 threonylcarbamoyl transferase component Bud32
MRGVTIVQGAVSPTGPVAPFRRIGSYRVERLLGTGSFATVWLGHDDVLGARVAIKVLAENWSHDLRVRQRFLDEARLLWRLDDERVVRVHSVGELDDGRPYAVMTWADRGSLHDRLVAGPVPAERAVELLRQIAAGVSVLHEQRIVHRDLTPGNVLLRSGGAAETDEQVLIADLGLAKALAAASGLTARAGTPGYMAPEQDDPLATVDTRADVYGLGRLGLRLRGAEQGRPGGGPPRLRPDVPPAVAGVLARATAYRPAERYPDAATFAAALDAALAARPEGDAPSGDGARSGARARRAAARPRRPVRSGWRLAIWLAGMAALAVLAAATLAVGAWALLVNADGNGMAAAGADGWPAADPSVSADPATLAVAVTPPPGWLAKGHEWEGGNPPAIVVSADPDRWLVERAIPGALVGLLRERGPDDVPQMLDMWTHPGCDVSPVTTFRRDGVDWSVVHRTNCSGGKPAFIEATGVVPGRPGLVYVQVVAPPGSDRGFVDALLGGVHVR